jgi:two-component system sensor histidine kinase UhpB
MKTKLLLNETRMKKNGSKNTYPGSDITQTLTNGFFSVNEQWVVKYWNKAAEELLGVRSQDIVGKNLLEKFADIIPSEFHSVSQKAFLNDIPLHFEEFWGEMGAWFDVITYYCDNTLSVSFKSSDHLHNGSPKNPTERLKTITELYKLVTEITNDCLWEWNLQEEEIFWIDGGHKRMFGYQVENALIPQSFWESRIHPEDKIRVLKKLKETFKKGKDCLWNDEYRFGRADGTYAHVHDRAHIIFKEGKASKMIGATQDVSEKVLLQEKLDEQKLSNQREITAAILTAHENERKEIGRELHDNLNQVLAVTKMYIQLAQKNENERDMYLEKSTGFITGIIEEISKISKTLVPPGMELLGLSDNIEILLKDFRVLNPIEIDFQEDGFNIKTLDAKLQLNIFRIIQEQLNNISRHSKATHAGIKLSENKNEIILVIADNGKGCDMTKRTNGIGIRNIMSRAELYYGTASFVSKPGKGYSITVTFPLNK